MKQYEAAYDDWQSGMKYREIAQKYGVSESTVKSWAARYWKQNTTEKVAKPVEKVAEVAEKEDKKVAKKTHQNAALPEVRDAPKACQQGNAGGAPKGNHNALKHGLRAKVYWDVLSEEEQALLAEMTLSNEEALLEEQIMLFTLRERRLLQTIADFKGQKGGLTLEGVTKRKLEIEGNFVNASTNKQSQTETTTKTIATFDVIVRLEAELTKVQAKKTKAIEDLAKLRLALKREVSDNQKQLVDDWVTALLEGDDDGQ